MVTGDCHAIYSDAQYKYQWFLVSQPETDSVTEQVGEMQGINTDTLKLSKVRLLS